MSQQGHKLGSDMTLDEVSALIEALPGVARHRQDGAVDFKVDNSIFVSITIDRLVVLKLSLEQQDMVVASEPKGFAPVKGGWGERGWTEMNFGYLDEAAALSGIMIAWTNVTPNKQRPKETPADIWRF